MLNSPFALDWRLVPLASVMGNSAKIKAIQSAAEAQEIFNAAQASLDKKLQEIRQESQAVRSRK